MAKRYLWKIMVALKPVMALILLKNEAFAEAALDLGQILECVKGKAPGKNGRKIEMLKP